MRLAFWIILLISRAPKASVFRVSVLKNFSDNALYKYIRVEKAGDLANRTEVSSGGVYAWYLPAPTMKNVLSIPQINEYYSSVSRAVSSERAKTERLNIKIELTSDPIKPSSAVQSHEEIVKAFIGISGLFSSPIYVGSTVDQGISDRVRQHLNGGVYGEKLVQRIRNSGFSDNIYPDVMIVQYFPIDTFLNETGLSIDPTARKALIEQLEETIFSIRLPSLNRKRGR